MSFKRYRFRRVTELRPYVPGEDVSQISIAFADSQAGSPKVGDMIARSLKNPKDQWLVSGQDFNDTYEPML